MEAKANFCETSERETPSKTAHPNENRKTISNPYLHRLQRRHFFIFDVAPIAGTLAAVLFTFIHPAGKTEIILFLSMWVITGLGITVGYHRLFTHRAFRTNSTIAAALTICGSMAGQGPLLSWVAIHRRHHEKTDVDGDPHSPNLFGSSIKGRLKGLLHSHFTWMKQHDYPNIAHYAPDLIRDKKLIKVARKYYYWVALGLILPATIGGIVYQSWEGAISGFLWGGVVRIFVLGHTIWAINSFLHMFGTRPYYSKENSRNGGIFSLLTFGEAWHNNHHAFPESPSFGLTWYRLDPGYWLIKLLAITGLAWDLRIPSEKRKFAKLRNKNKLNKEKEA